ncbi:MAG: phage holin [Clostridia bacterium]
MKEKFKNYGFWISLISAIVLFVQVLGFKVDVPYVNEVASTFLEILIILGIVSNPNSGNGYFDKK